jgi:hypothetical protein
VPVVDSETGAYERVPGRRLALTAVGLLAAAGGVGTFVFAVNVAGAAPTTDSPMAARREAPPSAMAAGGSVGTPAVATTGAAASWLVVAPAVGRSPGRGGATPSVTPAASASFMMGAADVEDEECGWCDDPHDWPDQDDDQNRWSRPTPTPSASPTPQPSPSDDLSMPTSGG